MWFCLLSSFVFFLCCCSHIGLLSLSTFVPRILTSPTSFLLIMQGSSKGELLTLFQRWIFLGLMASQVSQNFNIILHDNHTAPASSQPSSWSRKAREMLVKTTRASHSLLRVSVVYDSTRHLFRCQRTSLPSFLSATGGPAHISRILLIALAHFGSSTTSLPVIAHLNNIFFAVVPLRSFGSN